MQTRIPDRGPARGWLVLAAYALCIPITAANAMDVSGSVSAVLYQSFWFSSTSLGVGVIAEDALPIRGLKWGAGARVGLQQGGFDLFAQLLAAPDFGAWDPSVAVE